MMVMVEHYFNKNACALTCISPANHLLRTRFTTIVAVSTTLFFVSTTFLFLVTDCVSMCDPDRLQVILRFFSSVFVSTWEPSLPFVTCRALLLVSVTFLSPCPAGTRADFGVVDAWATRSGALSLVPLPAASCSRVPLWRWGVRATSAWLPKRSPIVEATSAEAALTDVTSARARVAAISSACLPFWKIQPFSAGIQMPP
mmetsp:Transcript_25883/g.47388  ORF Transcript_25883/g.47388 Transcript_25883/m.47388 type:complete len:200 (+) Transcript_25883:3-602(+)